MANHKRIKNATKVILWRVYRNFSNRWVLENCEVGQTDQMVFFPERTQFSEYCLQMALDRAKAMYGYSAQEAFAKAEAVLVEEIKEHDLRICELRCSASALSDLKTQSSS